MRSNSAKQGDQASWGLKLAAWGGLVFLHFPIVIICLYAFNTEDAAFSFPPQGFTLDWFSVAFAREDVLESIKLSLQIASIATLIAMVLGTLASAALYRRDAVLSSRVNTTPYWSRYLAGVHPNWPC